MKEKISIDKVTIKFIQLKFCLGKEIKRDLSTKKALGPPKHCYPL